MSIRGWIGVDLDATLAFYDKFEGDVVIGAPVPAMVDRVRRWLGAGIEVRVFTARVFEDFDGHVTAAVQDWCLKNIGTTLPVTCTKDWGMLCLYDDRCVQVIPNTGELVGGGSKFDEV